MAFNSLEYALFLPLVLALYWSGPVAVRRPILLVASYAFYATWDVRFLSLIVISTVVDFTVGRQLARSDDDVVRKRLLWTSVGVNLGILGVFKYAGFFVDSAEELLGVIGLSASSDVLQIVLPVGISFYTFQTISYSFDVYRRRIEPTSSLLTFAVYVAFFPQLVAGPIERARHLLPQLQDLPHRVPSANRLVDGAALIAWGLAKKLVVADAMAPVANDAFAASADGNAVMLTVGVVAFAIQIYGDFSGYTDIARGSARLLGIDLTVNFAQPYLSRNITEFWRRWHISLSNWLRDYLYVPLGGNRNGRVLTYRNLLLTMLLGGLWHGAAWTFVVWGGLHGAALGLHRWLRGGRVATADLSYRRPGDVLSALSTFAFVCVAWVFFRADSFSQAVEVLTGIATLRGITEFGGLSNLYAVGRVALWLLLVIGMDSIERMRTRPSKVLTQTPTQAGLAAGALAASLLLFSAQPAEQFIYFQF